jgi:hypothetical protein
MNNRTCLAGFAQGTVRNPSRDLPVTGGDPRQLDRQCLSAGMSAPIVMPHIRSLGCSAPSCAPRFDTPPTRVVLIRRVARLSTRAVNLTTEKAFADHVFVKAVAPSAVSRRTLLTCVGVHDRRRKQQFAKCFGDAHLRTYGTANWLIGLPRNSNLSPSACAMSAQCLRNACAAALGSMRTFWPFAVPANCRQPTPRASHPVRKFIAG